MLIVETIAKIRRYYFSEGKKIREISRELQLSRNTVRKVIHSGATEHSYSREKQCYPKLGPYLERLEKLLEDKYFFNNRGSKLNAVGGSILNAD